MKRKFFCLVVAVGLLFVFLPFTMAQVGSVTSESNEITNEPVRLEPMIVSASSIQMHLSEVASSITVITAEEIEARKAQDLKGVLLGVIGLDLAQNGGPGQLGSVFIRGADSARTLVMINGIPINDPITPARNTDISKISLDNVEQIEIVCGPQSVVFGSSAMSGIVNIITKKGSDVLQGSISVEAGKYSSLLAKLATSGSVGGIGYSLGASLENTEGFSAAKRSDDFVTSPPVSAMDNDGYRNLTLDFTLDYQLIPNLAFTLMNRYLTGDSEIDAYGGDYGDDPNFISKFVQTINQFSVNWDVLPGLWQQDFVIGMNQIDRSMHDAIDDAHPVDLSYSEYRSRNLTADWRHQVVLLTNNTLSLGLHYQQEQGMFHYYGEFLDYYIYQPTSSESSFAIRSAHQVGRFGYHPGSSL